MTQAIVLMPDRSLMSAGEYPAARRWLRACLVCRAGFAGRGTPVARATRRHTLGSPPTRDVVSGRIK
jgi:hypothetical protein